MDVAKIRARFPLPRVTESLPSGCGFCGKKENCKICSGCNAIAYCSEEHESAHRNAHLAICEAVRLERTSVEAAEADTFVCSRRAIIIPFINTQEMESLGFLQRRLAPILLQRIHTVESVRAQLAFYQRFELFVQCFPLMARLNDDQELYRAMKSWHLDLMDNPIPDANIFESFDIFLPRPDAPHTFVPTDMLLVLSLLKVTILLDLQRMAAAFIAVGRIFPREILEEILIHIPQSSAVKEKQEFTRMSFDQLSAIVQEIKNEVKMLYDSVHVRNQYFWGILVNHQPNSPVPELAAREGPGDKGQWDAQDLFSTHCYCWFEAPGAISLIRSIWSSLERVRGFTSVEA